jgi:hypothetical protein
MGPEYNGAMIGAPAANTILLRAAAKNYALQHF